MPPSAIIFDCDGVLVDSEQITIELEVEMLARLGLHYEVADFAKRFIGMMDRDFHEHIKLDFAALNRGPLPADFAEAMEAEKWQRFRVELKPVPGIAGFVDGLDCPMAVGSSSTIAGLEEKLHLTGLHDRFAPHIYSGELVQHGKPAPDLFLLAAARIEQQPAACLVIEDSINGVRAALAAGMTVWGFAGGAHADAGLASRLTAAGAQAAFTDYGQMAQVVSEAGLS